MAGDRFILREFWPPPGYFDRYGFDWANHFLKQDMEKRPLLNYARPCTHQAKKNI